MRILLSSNSGWTSTGYGSQTALLIPALKSLGHEVGLFAWYGLEGGMLEIDGDVPVYPRHLHLYGADVVGLHARHFNADIVITLIDAWVQQTDAWQHTRWVPWFPVDSEPLSPMIRDLIASSAFQGITYSKFGQRMAENAGLDTLYVPHSLDMNVFSPGSKDEAREKLGWPKDRFIMGMVAANKGMPSRKAFQQQLEAFARLKRKHADAALYLHTTIGTDYQGMNLAPFLEYLGLEFGRDVIAADQYRYLLGYPVEDVVTIYRALDCLTNVAKGEGFGLTILEAQACGTPVVVGDWTAMSELCFAGWKVPKEQADPVWEPLNCYQYSPRTSAIYECYKMAYRNARDASLAARARDGALPYDAETVTQTYWKPALEYVEQKIEDHVAGRALRVAGPLVSRTRRAA